MKTFAWNPSYEVGHPRIDREHKALLELTNEVLSLQGQPDVATQLNAILDRLLQYARVHFTAEEALMAEHGVDDRHAISHSEAHRAFAQEVRRIQQLPFEDEKVRRTGEFLSGWLIGHILTYDRALVRELGLDGAAAAQGLPRLGREQRGLLTVLTQVIEGLPVAAFVLDQDQRVRYWNRACVRLSQVPAHAVFGTNQAWRGFYERAQPVLANLLFAADLEASLRQWYPDARREGSLIEGTVETEAHFPHLGPGGRWLQCIAAPLHDEKGDMVGAVQALVDVTERRLARQALLDSQGRLEQEVQARTQELTRRNEELAQANANLVEMRQDLIQAEKMASLGQLAAGIAHEINNPMGYVHANLGSLGKYMGGLFRLLDAYEAAEPAIADAEQRRGIEQLRREVELSYLREDVPDLMRECHEGISRVRQIVQDLKDFSRADRQDAFAPADLHAGLDSTLAIVNNEIKYKADVVKHYGPIPPVECVASKINQVFMNLLVNAAQAMGEERGTITISTGVDGDAVWVEIADTGIGIAADQIERIFDHFYTTKPVGQGTGLGLSVSYGIVRSHRGSITVRSEPGRGSTFRVCLPIRHTVPACEPTSETASAPADGPPT